MLTMDMRPLGKGFEQIFNAPFNLVNAEVYRSLTIWSDAQALPVRRDDTPGATSYTVHFNSGEIFKIFVLHQDERITKIDVQLYISKAHPYVLSDDLFERINVLFHKWTVDILTAMRLSNPHFTLKAMQLAPPCPSWSEGPEDVFLWRAVYARDMSDKELAKLVDVPYGTLRNVKRQFDIQNRTPRGKNRDKV